VCRRLQVSAPGSIQFYSDGYTFNDVLFLGLFATSQSLASGQTNTISANAPYDVEVADDSLVKMVASSVLNLGSTNNVMNPDGSRIELSSPPAPTPS
jgi:hypothetical protein